jgi:hypothetical protein
MVRRMHALVHDSAFGREPVFDPQLLYMNQGALALTKEQVLECG